MDSNYGAVVPIFIDLLSRGKRPTIYGTGQQSRDFVHVHDVARLLVNLATNEWPTPSKSIYNVGTGKAETFNCIAENIFKFYQDEEKNFNYIEMPDYLVPKYQNFTQANIKKLIEAGYDYDFYSIEEGVLSYLNDLKTSSA